MTKPKVLLLDEPTEGIQPSIIKDISRALKEIRQLKNLTIVVSEQVLSFVLDTCRPDHGHRERQHRPRGQAQRRQRRPDQGNAIRVGPAPHVTEPNTNANLTPQPQTKPRYEDTDQS